MKTEDDKIRKQLEDKINNSTLFTIDRKDAVLFAQTKNSFLLDLIKLMEISRDDYEECLREIMETAKYSIENYNANKGLFLNNFNFWLAKKIKTKKGKERSDKCRKGIKISKKTDETIRKILNYIKFRNIDINKISQKKINDIAEGLGISPKQVNKAILANHDAVALLGDAPLKNGETDSGTLLDSITYDEEIDTSEIAAKKVAKKTIADVSALRVHILSIDEVFRKKQERTKKLLSKILTVWIFKKIRKIEDIDLDVIDKIFADADIKFVDSKIYKNFISSKKVPTQRKIAEMFGRHEADISRTLRKFKEKLKNSTKKC